MRFFRGVLEVVRDRAWLVPVAVPSVILVSTSQAWAQGGTGGAAEEGGGARVLGFYHSHPDALPLPSETDRELAWPWYLYVIIRVAAGEPEETRAWELDVDSGRFEERSIRYT